MNSVFNSNKEKFLSFFVYKGTEDITIKFTLNQNIRNWKKIYSNNLENNNPISIKIEELNEKQIFNFNDTLNDSNSFRFKIDLISSVHPLLTFFIVIISIIYNHQKKEKNLLNKGEFISCFK